MVRWLVAASLSAMVVPAMAHAQGLPRTDPMFQAIKEADARLFAASYGCDIAAFASLIDEDFEFYHDRTGLTVGKQALLQATRENLCHKVHRTLVAKSLTVFPTADYGAIEMGRHRFCNVVVETPICRVRTEGTGSFFMLWRKRPDGYKLARVISYDHVDH